MIIVQAVITALLSGVFSGFVLFALNDRRDRTSRRLSKLEEASEALYEWAEGMVAYAQSGYDLAAGRLTDAQWDERMQPVFDLALRNCARAETLIGVYAPTMVHVLDYVRHPLRDALTKLSECRKAAPKPGGPDAKLLDAMTKDNIAIVRGRQRGMNELAIYCRMLANQPLRKAAIEEPEPRKAS